MKTVEPQQPRSIDIARKLQHQMQEAIRGMREELNEIETSNEYFDDVFQLLYRTGTAMKELRNNIYRAEGVLNW